MERKNRILAYMNDELDVLDWETIEKELNDLWALEQAVARDLHCPGVEDYENDVIILWEAYVGNQNKE